MKITVLAGGNSPERQISEKSGIAVASALIRKGFEVALIDPAVDFDRLSRVMIVTDCTITPIESPAETAEIPTEGGDGLAE